MGLRDVWDGTILSGANGASGGWSSTPEDYKDWADRVPELLEARRLAAQDIAQTLPKKMTLGQGYDYACWVEATFPQLKGLADKMKRCFQAMQDRIDPPWRPEDVPPIRGTLVLQTLVIECEGAGLELRAVFEVED